MKRATKLFILILCLLMLCGCVKQETEVATLDEEQTVRLMELLESADSGSETERLNKYYEIIELDPSNIEIRLKLAQLQIVSEDYEMAERNLLLTAQMDPDNFEVYKLLSQMSNETDDLTYAYTAIELAEQNQQKEFLSLVPEAPQVLLEAGHYNERVYCELDTSLTNADIYFNISNDGNASYDISSKYVAPIALLNGNNTVSAYVVKDGIPSDTVVAEYTLSYEPKAVTFQEPAIEKMVRVALNKPTGVITDVDCESVDELSWNDLEGSIPSAYFEKSQIKTLEDLRYFPCLSRIDLQYQEDITDFSPLGYCPNIYWIQIAHCGLKNTNFLNYTPNASYIYLYSNEIRNIDVLQQFKNLGGLDLGENPAAFKLDTVIKNSPGMEYLYFEDSQLSDWNLLLELDTLSTLCVRGRSYRKEGIIAQLTSLEELMLYLSSNRYEWNTYVCDNFPYLNNMKNLRVFRTARVIIEKQSQIDAFKRLSNLEELVFYSSSIAMRELNQALPNCNIEYNNCYPLNLR